MPRGRAFSATAVAAAALASPLSAAAPALLPFALAAASDGAVYVGPDRRYLPSRPGLWQTRPPDVRNAGPVPVTNAERQQVAATLDAFRTVVRATPEGATLTGIVMNEVRLLAHAHPTELPAGVAPATQPLRFAAALYPFSYFEERVGGTWRVATGETESLHYWFNLLPGSLQPEDEWISEEPNARGLTRRYYLRPRITGNYAGMPVYEEGTFVFARPGRDPWQPATYGGVLRGLLHAAEERLREMESAWRDMKAADPGQRGEKPPTSADWYWNAANEVRDLQAFIASKPKQQIAGPVCRRVRPLEETVSLQDRAELIPAAPSPSCREVVTDNYAYFDPKLPRSAPQLLYVTFERCVRNDDGAWVPRREPEERRQGCEVHVPILQKLDWARVRALLAP